MRPGLRLRRLMHRIHAWLGLLLGLQILAWLLGGLVMSAIPIEMVRGSAWVTRDSGEIGDRMAEFRIAPGAIAAGHGGVATVTASLRLDRPVYELRDAERLLQVFDAATGEEIAPLDADAAAALARAAHRDRPAVREVRELREPEGEVRGAQLPLWQVTLEDRWHTRVYVEPLSARIVAVRNRLWRIYDFFWMLHIMDYDTRTDFNNTLLRGFSGGSLFLGLTGLWLLFYSFGRRRPAVPTERASR